MKTKVDVNNYADAKSTKVYGRRWFMLFLYFFSTILVSIQWSQYSSIANVIINYYNVSYEAVNWTSMIFLLFYIPLVFPVSYILEILGLRNGILAALLLTSLSCWLKVVALSPSRFWLVLLSQCIGALALPLILSALSLLAAEWFDLNQISTASSVGILAYQLGTGTGFMVPTFTVSKTFEFNTFEHNFYIMLLSIAIFSTAYLIIFFIFFEDKPPLPPSEAKLNNIGGSLTLTDFLQAIFKLVKNPSYIVLLIICGIGYGISTSIDTLLNQIMNPHYDDASVEAGRIAFVTYGTAAIGPLVAGLLLDKFNKYKFTLIVAYLFFLLLLVAFTFLFDKGLLAIYITLSLLGFFAGSIELITLETAMEITYPIPESVCSGLIFGILEAFSIGFIYFYSWTFYTFGEFFGNICLSVLCAIAIFLTLLIKVKHNRQNSTATAAVE